MGSFNNWEGVVPLGCNTALNAVLGNNLI